MEVDDNGRLIHLSGGRKVVEDGKVTEMKFNKKFTVGDNVEITNDPPTFPTD